MMHPRTNPPTAALRAALIASVLWLTPACAPSPAITLHNNTAETRRVIIVMPGRQAVPGVGRYYPSRRGFLVAALPGQRWDSREAAPSQRIRPATYAGNTLLVLWEYDEHNRPAIISQHAAEPARRIDFILQDSPDGPTATDPDGRPLRVLHGPGLFEWSDIGW